MAIRIKNVPSPEVLMNSMRAMGYSFKTAIADIIDNSISAKAKNIWLFFPTSSLDEQFVSIIDDGRGMNKEELFNAMKYGSDRKDSEEDLGRFGLGLKSASLSQCRVLTVASKKNGVISCFRWDLDEIVYSKEWNCLELQMDEFENMPYFSFFKSLNEGTIVLWQKFDIAEKKSSNGSAYSIIFEEIDEAEEHVRLIFHRFLNNDFKPVNIFFNNKKLIGLDPFLERSSNPKNDLKKPSSFFYKLDDGRNAEIIMQSCILPHQNDLTYADIESLGGENALRDGQGFYIYRNKRLIIYGTWFRLSGKGIDPELYKYGRIKIDIPNILDEIWEIDIKKQHASIPKDVLNLFKNAVSKICRTSKQKTEKRVRLSLETDDKRIWAKSKTREGKEIFYINSRSKFIENILDTFPDNEKGKVIRILETISATIPFDDIYASVCSRRQNEECLPEMVESIVDLGMLQIDQLSKKKCISLEDALILISQFEPFNDKKIQIKLKERIAYKNGK